MKWRSERRYRRLPGRPFAAISRDSLWLADDHLLLVQSNRFSETYRRYYFGDIQAFTIQRTAPVSPWTFFTGAIAAASLAPGLFFDFQRSYLWVMGGLFLAMTLALIGFGPTCACYIQTAVSRQKIGSLRWLRTAERMLRIVQPVIEQLQGSLTPEMAALPSDASGPGAAFAAPPPLPATKQPETGWGYEFLFIVLLLDGLHAALGLSQKGIAMDIAAWVILITEVVCIAWLILRQRRFEVPGAVRALVILALIVTAGFTYAVNFLTALSAQMKSRAANYLGYAPLHLIAVAVYGVLGVAGMVLITRYRRTARYSPSASQD